ncbi:hypothetical protein [Haloactinomyces albus]|uniref:Uncharacterized protein n=1 Tax=Haloactinomyces albus TaxID=1352928 RepID=A0AAE3ZFQ5_9ACTN|nr:hypothetical protein [Haloactinomyces albus]MDR7304116.1 hypothetical protein [Haloactinomyces albus]
MHRKKSERQAFDEQIRWTAPHPTGTHFNIDHRTRAEVVDERTVRLSADVRVLLGRQQREARRPRDLVEHSGCPFR